MKIEDIKTKDTLKTIFDALGASKNHNEIWAIVDRSKTEQDIVDGLRALLYKEKVDFVVRYFETHETETWVVAQAMDKFHLEKAYQIIKDNPNITQGELVEILNLEVW